MEDYGFEYSEEEQEEEDVDIENQYYNAKGIEVGPVGVGVGLKGQGKEEGPAGFGVGLKGQGLVETDPEGALAGFAEVVHMEAEKAECPAVYLHFRVTEVTARCAYKPWGFKALKQTVKLYYRLGKYAEMMQAYREMLSYIKSAVTRNYSEKCINNIMDFISGSASQNFGLLQEFYQTTLKALEEAKNERLWFKTNLKLCKIWFDIGEYGRLSKILKELHKSCRKEDGTDDHKKGTQLLEVYAIEIQIYLVLANMLMESEVNPFDGQETKPYKNDPEILAMTNLIAAYQRNEILEFEKILKELNVPEQDVEQLLVSLILDNRIHGHIDQVNRLLERWDRSKGTKKYAAVEKWNTQLKSLYQTINNRVC
uniref:COP9 signalosome complex subunit 2 n=1 Tax=Fagus sylvatica TaxID=28930 RepID=A0A2N9G444_FAGSY